MTNRKPPVEKNQLLTVTFEDLTHEGQAVAKVDGYPIFVPYGLVGETATIKIVKQKKNIAFGRLIEVNEASVHRQEPPCPVYKQCGGCQLQHIDYEGQLKAKEKQVRDVMKRIGKLEDVMIHPVLGMEDPWMYRNKSQVPVGEREGGLVVGFYQKRTHQITDMERCMIQSTTNDELIQSVKGICEKYNVPAYNEQTHTGVIRHFMVRYGYATGETMLVIVTKTKKLASKENIIKDIVEKHPNITSIVHNINEKRTNVVLGDTTNVLYGNEYIYDAIGDVTFAISARSFYQVNPVQTKVLYDKALQYAGLTGEETVIDAYCGIGTISLFLAQKAKHVYGVEIVPEAIEDAKRNATLNKMDNVTFAVGKAEEVIPSWYKEGIKADVICVDPPRKGCDEALLNTILAMKPKKVVYVSCDPATLARDLRILEDGGYRTTEIQPVDMFPQTNHIENVAQLVLEED